MTFLGRVYYDSGELRYEGELRSGTPFGYGTKYFKNGNTEMTGRFGDWFLEEGKEYYEDGTLKFEGRYNEGPRTYYGPRYFLEGNLYRNTGERWYSGTFAIERQGNLGYPRFLGRESFRRGVEFNAEGRPIKIYR